MHFATGAGKQLRRCNMGSSIYDTILQKVKEFDAGARVASISRRDADDGVLVRFDTKTKADGMLQSLREAWPLASVSVVKNLINGRTEAQVLLPNEHEQREIAKGLAHASAWEKPLRLLANGLMALLAVACVQRVVQITSGPGAGG
jgi:hypothetical protein